MANTFATTALACPKCHKNGVVSGGTCLKCMKCNHEFTLSAQVEIGLPREIVEVMQRTGQMEKPPTDRSSKKKAKKKQKRGKSWDNGRLTQERYDELLRIVEKTCPEFSLPNDFGYFKNEVPFWRRTSKDFSGGKIQFLQEQKLEDEEESESIPLEFDDEDEAE